MEESMVKLQEETDSDGPGWEARNKKMQAKRVRTNFSEVQLRRLDDVFVIQPFPGREWINKLSDELGLSYFSIKTWFQNRRSKSRRNGTFDIDSPATSADSEFTFFPEIKTPVQHPPDEATCVPTPVQHPPDEAICVPTDKHYQQLYPQYIPLPMSHYLPPPNGSWNFIKFQEEPKELDKFSIDAILAKPPDCHFREAETEFSMQNKVRVDNGSISHADIRQSSPEAALLAYEHDVKHVGGHYFVPSNKFQDQTSPEMRRQIVTEYQTTSGKLVVTSPDTKNYAQMQYVNSDKTSEDEYSALYEQYASIYHQYTDYSYPWYEFYEKTRVCHDQTSQDADHESKFYEKGRVCHDQISQDMDHESKCVLVCDLDSQQVKEVKREKLPDVHPTNHHVLSWKYIY